MTHDVDGGVGKDGPEVGRGSPNNLELGLGRILVLRCRCPGVTLVPRWSYTGIVLVLLHWCGSGTALAPPRLHYTGSILVLTWYYPGASWVLPWYYLGTDKLVLDKYGPALYT